MIDEADATASVTGWQRSKGSDVMDVAELEAAIGQRCRAASEWKGTVDRYAILDVHGTEAVQVLWASGGCPPQRECHKAYCRESDKLLMHVRPCCRAALLRMLFVLADELDARNVTWFLDAGSHLGAVRDGGFIPYDDDVDIVADERDAAQFWAAVSHALRETPESVVTVNQWTPRRDAAGFAVFGLRIDFWFFSRAEGMLRVASSAVHDKPLNDVFPLRRAPFNGVPLPIPKRSHRILHREYGNDYQHRVCQ